MPPTITRWPIEPLFTSNARLWLRVWGLTQAAALTLACYLSMDRVRGLDAFVRWPIVAQSGGIIVLLIAYHAAGIAAYPWIISRRLAVAAYVPLGWLLIALSMRIGGAFSLLLLGAVIQGFIFLPFAWAFAALTLSVSALVIRIVTRGSAEDGSVVMLRAGGILSIGIAIGTVMLYIHRVNRDSASRARLLLQLDEAQRDLAARARESGVQEERQRLALDIHDTLAQGFASVIRHLEAVSLSFASGGSASDLIARAAPHLAHAQAASRSSLAEIRRVVWALRPPQLAQSTLSAAIERLVAHWSEMNGVPAVWTAGSVPPLLPDAEVIFLRAAQEALSNVAKHADATHVDVSLSCVDGLVLLSVDDDGRGVADADTAGVETIGIRGMRERARRMGGHVLIESGVGAGTSVTVALPLSAIVPAPQ